MVRLTDRERAKGLLINKDKDFAHGVHEPSHTVDGIDRWWHPGGHDPRQHEPPNDPSGNPIEKLRPTDDEIPLKLPLLFSNKGTLLASKDWKRLGNIQGKTDWELGREAEEGLKNRKTEGQKLEDSGDYLMDPETETNRELEKRQMFSNKDLREALKIINKGAATYKTLQRIPFKVLVEMLKVGGAGLGISAYK